MAEYDASKNYRWLPDSKYELNGSQFGITLNALRAILSTPEAQRIIKIKEAHDEMESLLRKSVEEGVAVEVESGNPPTPPPSPLSIKK